MLAVPSLKPIRLRGVAWLRLVLAVRPKPSCDQRMTTVPRPIRARVRIGAKTTRGARGRGADRVKSNLGVVGAGLHADVAAAFELVQLVGGQRRDRRQRGGTRLLQ